MVAVDHIHSQDLAVHMALVLVDTLVDRLLVEDMLVVGSRVEVVDMHGVVDNHVEVDKLGVVVGKHVKADSYVQVVVVDNH